MTEGAAAAHRTGGLPPAPVTGADRIGLLDALRGFALLGILLANTQTLTGWSLPPASGITPPDAPHAEAWILGIDIATHGRFYTLFSLLFGIGAGLQLGFRESRRPGATGRYMRRLGWLALIGALHTVVWLGDILFYYAILGFGVVLCRNLSQRGVWIAAGVCLALPILDSAVRYGTAGGAVAWDPGAAMAGWAFTAWPGDTVGMSPFDVPAHGGWGELAAAAPFHFAVRAMIMVVESRPPRLLGIFLLGFWLARTGFLRDPGAYRRALIAVAAVGLLVAGPLGVWLEASVFRRSGSTGSGYPLFSPDGTGLLQQVLVTLAVIPVALGYGAVFTLVFLSATGRRVLSVLAPAGRTALTCYLSQSLVAQVLMLGVGFGLYQTVPPHVFVPAALVFFALQSALAALWLRWFRFGPCEWIWRCLTYGRRFPLRQQTAPRCP